MRINDESFGSIQPIGMIANEQFKSDTENYFRLRIDGNIGSKAQTISIHCGR